MSFFGGSPILYVHSRSVREQKRKKTRSVLSSLFLEESKCYSRVDGNLPNVAHMHAGKYMEVELRERERERERARERESSGPTVTRDLPPDRCQELQDEETQKGIQEFHLLAI